MSINTIVGEIWYDLIAIERIQPIDFWNRKNGRIYATLCLKFNDEVLHLTIKVAQFKSIYTLK